MRLVSVRNRRSSSRFTISRLQRGRREKLPPVSDLFNKKYDFNNSFNCNLSQYVRSLRYVWKRSFKLLYLWLYFCRTRTEICVPIRMICVSENTRRGWSWTTGFVFAKRKELASPLGREGGIEIKEEKGRYASATMIIASCSFHGTAHDHPKISVCNGISSSFAPVAIRPFFTASLPPFVLRAPGREAIGYLSTIARESLHILI